MGLFEQTITDIVINLLFVQPLNECIQCLFRARAFLLLMQLKQFYVFFILISVPNDESLFLSHGHISYSLSTLLLCVCVPCTHGHSAALRCTITGVCVCVHGFRTLPSYPFFYLQWRNHSTTLISLSVRQEFTFFAGIKYFFKLP